MNAREHEITALPSDPCSILNEFNDCEVAQTSSQKKYRATESE